MGRVCYFYVTAFSPVAGAGWAAGEFYSAGLPGFFYPCVARRSSISRPVPVAAELWIERFVPSWRACCALPASLHGTRSAIEWSPCNLAAGLSSKTIPSQPHRQHNTHTTTSRTLLGIRKMLYIYELSSLIPQALGMQKLQMYRLWRVLTGCSVRRKTRSLAS